MMRKPREPWRKTSAECQLLSTVKLSPEYLWVERTLTCQKPTNPSTAHALRKDTVSRFSQRKVAYHIRIGAGHELDINSTESIS